MEAAAAVLALNFAWFVATAADLPVSGMWTLLH